MLPGNLNKVTPFSTISGRQPQDFSNDMALIPTEQKNLDVSQKQSLKVRIYANASFKHFFVSSIYR